MDDKKLEKLPQPIQQQIESSFKKSYHMQCDGVTRKSEPIIHPLKQELLVNPDHPYFAQISVK